MRERREQRSCRNTKEERKPDVSETKERSYYFCFDFVIT